MFIWDKLNLYTTAVLPLKVLILMKWISTILVWSQEWLRLPYELQVKLSVCIAFARILTIISLRKSPYDFIWFKMKLFRRKSHGWEKLDEKKIDNHGIGRQRGRNPRRIMTNRLSARIRSFLSCFRPFVCYQGNANEQLFEPWETRNLSDIVSVLNNGKLDFTWIDLSFYFLGNLIFPFRPEIKLNMQIVKFFNTANANYVKTK